MEIDEGWERLKTTFFRPARRPNPLETEAFVSKVMARLEPRPSFSFLARWLESRWTVPALSLGLTALFVSILLPRPEAVAPMDTLFLSDTREAAAAALLLPPDASRAEALLNPAVDEP